jgi:hypothetical protein
VDTGGEKIEEMEKIFLFFSSGGFFFDFWPEVDFARAEDTGRVFQDVIFY